MIFVGIAIVNGMITIINKMVNLQAKQTLGMANGTLINYFEGTIISLVLLILMGGSKLTNLSYLKAIPPIYFLGGLFGLLSMIFVLIGMAKNQISYSTVVVLIGQLGAGLLIDSIVTQKIVPVKVLGIALVIIGVFVNHYLSHKPTKVEFVPKS